MVFLHFLTFVKMCLIPKTFSLFIPFGHEPKIGVMMLQAMNTNLFFYLFFSHLNVCIHVIISKSCLKITTKELRLYVCFENRNKNYYWRCSSCFITLILVPKSVWLFKNIINKSWAILNWSWHELWYTFNVFYFDCGRWFWTSW
jgi:hypothetical protein